MPPTVSQLSNPDFTSQLDIESLIAAPLIAVSKANVVMITGQTRALLENCFKKQKEGHYEPVMIDMMLVRGNVAQDASETPAEGETPAPKVRVSQLKFSVPLVSIVPINNLVVNKVDVDFDLEITSVYHKPTTRTLPDNEPINEKRAILHGKIANTKKHGTEDDTGSARLKVSIHAGPLPLPLGILNILELYSKSIHPISLK